MLVIILYITEYERTCPNKDKIIAKYTLFLKRLLLHCMILYDTFTSYQHQNEI